MKTLIDWYLDRRLAWKKRKGLHEVIRDLRFIEKHRADYISDEAESKLREDLAKERDKANPDPVALEGISRRIAEANATMREYEKLKKIVEELPKYIASIYE